MADLGQEGKCPRALPGGGERQYSCAPYHCLIATTRQACCLPLRKFWGPEKQRVAFLALRRLSMAEGFLEAVNSAENQLFSFPRRQPGIATSHTCCLPQRPSEGRRGCTLPSQSLEGLLGAQNSHFQFSASRRLSEVWEGRVWPLGPQKAFCGLLEVKILTSRKMIDECSQISI